MTRLSKDNKSTRKASSRNRTTKSAKAKTTPKNEVITNLKDLPEPKAVVACTKEQYHQIIYYLWNGSPGKYVRKNRRVATLLQLQANTGLRVGDAIRLRLDDIIRDGNRYRFSMRESKTKKIRTFTVPDKVYNMLYKYTKANHIARDERMFDCTIRCAQKSLDRVTDFLGFERIGTHSFRKFFATQAYEASGFDIEVVRRLLNHSSASITLRYIGISETKLEKTLRKIVNVDYTYSLSDPNNDEPELPAPKITAENTDVGLSRLPQGGLEGLEKALIRDICDAEGAKDKERLLPLKCTLGVLKHYVDLSPSGKAFPTVKTEDARVILKSAGYPIQRPESIVDITR